MCAQVVALRALCSLARLPPGCRALLRRRELLLALPLALARWRRTVHSHDKRCLAVHDLQVKNQ